MEALRLTNTCEKCGYMKLMPNHFKCMYKLDRYQLKDILNNYINSKKMTKNEYISVIEKILPPISSTCYIFQNYQNNNEIYELMYREWWVGLDYIQEDLDIGFRSWTLPQPYKIINKLIKFINKGLILEICSGSALQSAILSAFGCKIIATDSYIDIPQKPDVFTYIPVEKLNAKEALIKYGSKVDVLMIIWGIGPPDYELLQKFKGNKIISIGEPLGGCTCNGILDYINSDDENHNEINDEWKLLEQIHMYTWYGIHDIINLIVRK